MTLILNHWIKSLQPKEITILITSLNKSNPASTPSLLVGGQSHFIHWGGQNQWTQQPRHTDTFQPVQFSGKKNARYIKMMGTGIVAGLASVGSIFALVVMPDPELDVAMDRIEATSQEADLALPDTMIPSATSDASRVHHQAMLDVLVAGLKSLDNAPVEAIDQMQVLATQQLDDPAQQEALATILEDIQSVDGGKLLVGSALQEVVTGYLEYALDHGMSANDVQMVQLHAEHFAKQVEEDRTDNDDFRAFLTVFSLLSGVVAVGFTANASNDPNRHEYSDSNAVIPEEPDIKSLD